LEGGCDEPTTWSELGLALEQMGISDDAAVCLEAALFYGADEQALRERLAKLRATILGLREEEGSLFDQLAEESPNTTRLAYIGARFLADLQGGRPIIEELFLATRRLFSQTELPSSARLLWMSLSAPPRRSGDRLELTRCKELSLGRLNLNGLKAALNVPRFVRLATSLEEEEVEGKQGQNLSGLLELWVELEPRLEELEVQSTFYRALFAVAFHRAGGRTQARQLTEMVEEELPVHDAPVRAALQLYLGLISLSGVEKPEEERQQLLEAQLNTLNSKEQRLLQVLLKRSPWFGGSFSPGLGALQLSLRLRRGLEDLGREQVLRFIESLFQGQRYFEEEIQEGCRQSLEFCIETGDENLLFAAIKRIHGGSAQLKTPHRRAALLGQTIRGATILEHNALIDQALEECSLLVPQVPRLGELIRAIEPAMGALRRFGGEESALRFLDALQRAGEQGIHRERHKLLAYNIDALHLLGQTERSAQLLEILLDRILNESMDHVARYEAGAATLESLRSWPHEQRQSSSLRLMDNLSRFRDNFTSNRLFAVHQILIMERILDVSGDRVEYASRRLQRWLELEEQAIRRQILKDWRAG